MIPCSCSWFAVISPHGECQIKDNPSAKRILERDGVHVKGYNDSEQYVADQLDTAISWLEKKLMSGCSVGFCN
jgi:hypothetical protein